MTVLDKPRPAQKQTVRECKPKRDPWQEYYSEKSYIAATAETCEEYERMIGELTRRLGL